MSSSSCRKLIGGQATSLTAAHCGLAVAYVPSGRNDRSGQPRADKGNAVLSTLPIDDVVAVEAPYETERKVVLAAVVPLPEGRRLRVVAAHLDVTTTFSRTLLSGNQTRTRQARGVLEALESLERAEGAAPPMVVGGDFNTWSSFDGTLRLFRAALPDSPEWDGRPTRGPFPTDHVFFRKGADPRVAILPDSYRRLDARYGSDHEPLVVWLSLDGRGAPR
jgi:endonuclease/exonuclease/phosphatase family metal-dependent hydrolase